MTEFAAPPAAGLPADPLAYQAAYAGAVLFDESIRGRIWMRDRDRAALLHRLSTNQIERLSPGQGTLTVLTTPIGRIIDLLTVYALDEGLLIVTSPERGSALASHLRKNIFFNDKVKLEDATLSLGQLLLAGPQAPALLTALELPGADLPAYGVVQTGWQDAPLYVVRQRAFGATAFWLIAPPATLATLQPALTTAGAQILDPATAKVLRVEHGDPAYGHELSTEYIPLETGLWDAVSFTKGCYVGQEIIARMESRGRLAKRLCGLRLAQLPSLPEATPLAKLDAAGKEAGDLTSLALSPVHGPIGLAYVRTAYAEPGTHLLVAGISAEVVSLPFKR
ncbi:MAG: YgfZ/GcvT domain-containing protein [Oscillochloridaceae bacterium umkhey_bin13]